MSDSIPATNATPSVHDTVTLPVTKAAQLQSGVEALGAIAAAYASPSKEGWTSAARHALTALGGILASAGFLKESYVVMGISLIPAAIGTIWGIVDEHRSASAIKAAATDAALAEKKEANRAAVYAPLLALMLLSTALFSGCAHYSAVPLDNTPGLRARADFDAARRAAPEWTLAALNTIADLEREVALAAPFGVKVAAPAP